MWLLSGHWKDLVTVSAVTFTVSALHPPWPLQSSFEDAIWLSPSVLLQENTRDWVANKQHNFIFHSLEARSPRSIDSVSSEGLLPGSYWSIFLLCPHMVGGARELSWVPFIRDVISSIRTLPLWLHHLQKVSPLNTITLGVRFQHMNGDVTFSQ